MTDNWHILNVGMDSQRHQTLTEYLGRHGFQVSMASTSKDLWKKLERHTVNMLILGPNARGEVDLELLKKLRCAMDLPLIVTDATGDDVERILALEMGADDYLKTPFDPRELLARIRAFQRRALHSGPSRSMYKVYEFSGWRFVPEQQQLIDPQGESLRLTTSECKLLLAFVESPQRVLGREKLLRLIGSSDAEVIDRSIDVLVWRLRRKLQDRTLIKTERSAGYVFTARVEASIDAKPQTVVHETR